MRSSAFAEGRGACPLAVCAGFRSDDAWLGLGLLGLSLLGLSLLGLSLLGLSPLGLSPLGLGLLDLRWRATAEIGGPLSSWR